MDFERFSRTRLKLSLPLVGAALATAVLAVIYARAFGYFEKLAIGFFSERPARIFFMAPAAFLSSWLLVEFFAPGAGGSGIPQLIATIRIAESDPASSRLKALLGLPMIFVKFIGSCLCVLGGGATGREGPTLQMAAGIFYSIRRWLPDAWPQVSLSSMILAGGSAGLAAAFNTPLGGIVFAVEELARVHLSQIRGAVLLSVLAAGLSAQLLAGSYLYLGPIHSVPFAPLTILKLVLMAAVIGALGGAFSDFTIRALAWRKRLPTLAARGGATLGCALIFALIAWASGAEALGSGRESLKALLFEHADGGVKLALARYAGNFFTFVSGVAGGVFAPALATGAACASTVLAWFPPEVRQITLMVGMAAFLTGVTHTPLTSLVLVMEMTEASSATLPLLVGVGSAYVAAKCIDHRSFYERASEAWERA